MKPRYYLALYKGHRGGSGWRVWCARATDWLTRILTRGQYSHAEIAYGPVGPAAVGTAGFFLFGPSNGRKN